MVNVSPMSAMISVVVPAHNEVRSIKPLMDRLETVLRGCVDSFEVIVVDDRSTDGTFGEVVGMRADRPWIKAIRLSRNFGKEIALVAGMRAAKGDAIVQIDADLQHPPELIAEFVAAWRNGARVVYGARDRSQEGRSIRNALTHCFYWLFDRVAEVRLLKGGGDFALFDRQVVDVLIGLPERNRFGKGLYAWVGFEPLAIPYRVEERRDGTSRWSPLRLTGLATDALISFSVVPLRVWSFIGAVISFLSIAYGCWIAVETVVWGRDVPGYPSLMVGIALLGGVQLISLGVLGEYLGQVYLEVKRRPLYVIDQSAGIDVLPEPGSSAPTPVK
jgi:glycosyltransferase involved in cell wall biosynthesis